MSALADKYGWEGGWRIRDTPDYAIASGGCGEFLIGVPFVFVLDTHSMTVVAADTANQEINVVFHVGQIDEFYQMR